MLRALLIAVAFIGLAASSGVHAVKIPLNFGKTEEVRHVAHVDLKTSTGGGLFLARKLTTLHFFVPVWQSDDGFVLGTGARGYYDLPQGEELKAIQARGLLPSPLPNWRRSPSDFIEGYLGLWCLLFTVLVFTVYFRQPLHKRMALPPADSFQAEVSQMSSHPARDPGALRSCGNCHVPLQSPGIAIPGRLLPVCDVCAPKLASRWWQFWK